MSQEPKAQETQDAELIALAALVERESVISRGHIVQYGQFLHDPVSEASKALERLLVARGVLSEQAK